jgi:hypothetical protein
MGSFVATLGDEPLAIGVGREVAGVDGDVLAQVGSLLLDALDHGGDAGVEQMPVLPELRGKALTGVDARAVPGADRSKQSGVLTDQRHRARPGRDRVEGLGERNAYH